MASYTTYAQNHVRCNAVKLNYSRGFGFSNLAFDLT